MVMYFSKIIARRLLTLLFLGLSFASAPAESLPDLYKPSRIYEHCMENAWTIEEQVNCGKRELPYQDEQLAYAYAQELHALEAYRDEAEEDGNEFHKARREERIDEFVATQQAWLRARDAQTKFYAALNGERWKAEGLISAVLFTARRVEYLLQFFDLSALPPQTQLVKRARAATDG